MEDINENIYGKYNYIFRDAINVLLLERSLPSQESFHLLSDEGMYGIKLKSIILPYFEASNGYAGFDISVIRYNSYHIIFWYKILTSKNTSDKEKEIACAEITIFFYHWIGAFYSCKEKLLSFIGAKLDKSRIKFENTCLSEKGQKAILSIFSNYSNLIEIFSIRNRVIHDSYDFEMDHEALKMKIKHFGFSLTSEKDKRNSDYYYNIDEVNISSRFNDIVHLLEDYISIIKNIENINISCFKKKYTDADGKFRMSI